MTMNRNRICERCGLATCVSDSRLTCPSCGGRLLDWRPHKPVVKVQWTSIQMGNAHSPTVWLHGDGAAYALQFDGLDDLQEFVNTLTGYLRASRRIEAGP